MELVYIGFFSRVFEWVLSRIISPVYQFVSSLLTTVFTWLFNSVLAPILMPILKDVMNFAIELWLQIYCTQLYVLFSGVLKIIDYMETAFDVFIGLKDVTYRPAQGAEITGSLVDVLLQQDTISTVFWMVTFGGLGLALMLTIFATAKSAFDLDFENKRPVSKVLAAMLKAFVQFFTVPFLVYFLVKLSAVILRGVTSAMSYKGETSLGRIVFTIASLDAARDPAYNISTVASGLNLGPEDKIRNPFYVLSGDKILDYGQLKDVNQYFDLAKMDYLIGFIAAVFLLFTIGMCLIIFVQRIFEILLLYLVSPYFVCTMPLDDGEKFSKWRDMFVGKCFTGFGSAIGMRLYLLVCPMMMGGGIRFGDGTSPEMDYMIRLFFLIGGAWAVYKSGPMLTSLISFQAGQSEASTAAVAGGFLFSQTAGKAIAKGKGALKSGASKLGQSKSGKNDKDGAFTGTKKEGQGAGKPGLKGKSVTPLKAKDGVKAGKPGIWTDTAKNKESKGLAAKKGLDTVGDKLRESAWKKGISPSQKEEAGQEGLDTAGDKFRESAWKKGISPSQKEEAGQEGRESGLELGAYRRQEHRNVNLGGLFSSTYDEQGNHKLRVMGMGFTKDYLGRTTSYNLPNLSIRRDAMTGSKSLSHLKLPGIADIHTNIDGGGLKYSDISVLGTHYRKGSEGKSLSMGKSFSVDIDQQGGLGSLNVSKYTMSSEEGGMNFSYGKHFSLSVGNNDKLNGVRIAGLNYQRSGNITRSTGKTGNGQEGKA